MHSPRDFRRMLFRPGYRGGAGSLRDYYLDQSGGSFEVTGSVAPWKRLPRRYGSYAGSSFGYQETGPNSQTMVAHAVKAADAHIDFCRSDRDDNGIVDTLFLVHAGTGAEETGSGVWSLSWWLDRPLPTDDVCGGRRVAVQGFTIQPERYKNPAFTAPKAPRKMVSIGVFAHELGHVLGLPDLYDTGHATPGGVGTWELMASGAYGFDGTKPWRPTPMSAWTRARLGWAEPRNVSRSVTGALLDLVNPSGTYIYRVAADGSSTAAEYFLIEARSPEGWAADFPARGTLIWHIDERQTGNDGRRHLVHLVQADGLNELGKSRDFFEAADVGDMWRGLWTLSPSTSPASDLYGGVDSGISIRIRKGVLGKALDILI